MNKYNEMWLLKNHLDASYHEGHLQIFKDVIANCKQKKLIMTIQSQDMFEAILPELLKYNFTWKVDNYYGMPFNTIEVTIR